MNLSIVDEGVSKDTSVNERLGYIGASDISVICGINPWKTPLKLYLEKSGEIEADDLSNNERIWWGTELEESIAKRYSVVTGQTVRRDNQLLKHKKYPFIACHRDRIIQGSRKGLECKNTEMILNWGEPGTDQVPEYYYSQVQYMMAIDGRESYDIAVLFKGNELGIYTVPRNEEYIKAIITLAVDFWKNIKKGILPKLSTLNDASLLYRKVIAKRADATLDIVACRDQLKFLYQEQNVVESSINEFILRIKEYMGENGDELFFNDEKIATWKSSTAKRLDKDRFKKEYPDLYKDYTKETKQRRFELKRFLKGAKNNG